MSQNLSSAVVIGALRVKVIYILVTQCQVSALGPFIIMSSGFIIASVT